MKLDQTFETYKGKNDDVKALTAHINQMSELLNKQKLQIERQGVNSGNQVVINAIVSAAGGGGGGGGTAVVPSAGSFTITTIADTVVSFLTPIASTYTLIVLYQSGTLFNVVNVSIDDQTGAGFTVRAGDMPGTGNYYYAAIPTK